jgi:hypothetical protein
MLLAITGQQALLDQNPLLARSVKNRFPYLDPLNHVQIELLKRHRAGDTDERVHQRDSRRVAQQWLVSCRAYGLLSRPFPRVVGDVRPVRIPTIGFKFH